MFQEMQVNSGGGGSSAEKPTLLWNNASGTNSRITIDHSAYSYLILICGFPANSSVWGDRKKATICDKTKTYHCLAMGCPTQDSYTYMTAKIGTGYVEFARTENATYDKCYAVYGCSSLSIDFSEIWERGDVF